MNLLRAINIFFIHTILFIWVSCSNNPVSMIQTIRIGANNGVGPNVFLVIVKTRDNDLLKILEDCNAELFFSQPVKELGESSITCFKISSNEIHLRIESTLWADLNTNELKKKEKDINASRLSLNIKNKEGKSWIINNPMSEE